MERLFPEKLKHKSAYMRILIGRATNDTTSPFKYITGGFQTYSDSYCVESTGVVDKGTYYAYVELDWTNDLINEFAL